MGVQINGSEGNVIATKGTYSGNVTIGGTLTYEDVTNIDSVGIITARSGIEIGASPGVGASISVDGNAIFSGITTATTLRAPTGIVTSLEATTGNITTLRAPTGIVTSFVTNTAKVGGGVTISESGIEASGIGITVANINGTQIGGRRNLIINGDFQVAQRATTSTTNGYGSVDRFRTLFNGTDENPTHSQVDVVAGTTPYTLGFRKALNITNGNQTGGAGATDYIQILTTIEARDIAQSGWNYTSSASFITLSFWVKSSVAQNFYGAVRTQDGTVRSFPFETGSLSANTWKKVVIKIPGDSSNTFNTDNGAGLQIFFWAFRGTDYTGSVTLNQWNTWNTNTGTPDMTSTWYTTNDATLEFTGYQLEVGSEATAFEHRTYGEELTLCERYCQVIAEGANRYFATSFAYNTSLCIGCFTYKTQMRSAPSMLQTTGTNYYFMAQAGTIHYFTQFEALSHVGKDQSGIYPQQSAMSVTAGQAGGISTVNAAAQLILESEI